MRYLGIDYGTKNIGLAISDESGRFAFPHDTIINIGIEKSVEKIKIITDDKKIGKIILGKSLDYNGEPNLIMTEIEKFKNILEEKTGIDVAYENEVLTTMEAKRHMRGERVRPPVAKKRSLAVGIAKEKKTVDASAAALILKSFLDKNNV